jgi:ligand-binding SRPBCC domain-containing protein
MPVFQSSQTFPRPVADVFDFFCQPANLLRVSPPELHMRLIEAPPRIQLGSRVTLEGRRYGVPQRIVSEVVVFEPHDVFADDQREGPFRKWLHHHRFEAVPGGTRVADQIEFEPPGGILGLMLNAAAIERDLDWLFEYRRQKLREILGDPPA